MFFPILALTQVLYTEAWSMKGLESNVNSEIIRLEKSAEVNNQIIEVKDIKFIVDQYRAYIIYEIIDKPVDTH